MVNYKKMMDKWRDWRLDESEDLIENHNSCECNGASCTCEIVTESARDIVRIKKLVQKLGTIEGKFRKTMYDLSDALQADTVNHGLMNLLKKAYIKNITKFMRELISISKKVR